MLDRKPEKAEPETDTKVLSPKQKKVHKQKLDALRSGNMRGWPSKRQQNEWD
jgi:hypothetical protein